MADFKPPRSYVPSDVNTADDPLIIAAGALAELLFRRGNEYCKRVGNDGVFPKAAIDAFGLRIPGKLTTHAQALVDVGLWADEGDSFRVTKYLCWNMSQEQMRDARERKRIGALKTNHKRGLHAAPVPDCPDCEQKVIK